MIPRIEAFRAAADALNGTGVPWWLSSGTALGHVRDGRLIASDGDIDLGVWIADIPAALAALRELGPVTRDRPHQINIEAGGVKLDVHGHEHAGSEVFFRLGLRGRSRYVFPAHVFDKPRPTVFYRRDTSVPWPVEEYLEAHYGPDWATPRDGWRWDVDPPCLRR